MKLNTAATSAGLQQSSIPHALPIRFRAFPDLRTYSSRRALLPRDRTRCSRRKRRLPAIGDVGSKCENMHARVRGGAACRVSLSHLQKYMAVPRSSAFPCEKRTVNRGDLSQYVAQVESSQRRCKYCALDVTINANRQLVAEPCPHPVRYVSRRILRRRGDERKLIDDARGQTHSRTRQGSSIRSALRLMLYEVPSLSESAEVHQT
jgi:hypothetical protein